MRAKTADELMDEMEERIEHLEEVLKQIGDMSHDASGTGDSPAGLDVYWDIRRLAYDAWAGK